MSALDIKAAVRQRDGMRCTQCGMTNDEHRVTYGKSLEVHRVIPGSPYSLEVGACVTLCFKCHLPKPKSPRRPGEWRGGRRCTDGGRAVGIDPDLYQVLHQLADDEYRRCPVATVHTS